MRAIWCRRSVLAFGGALLAPPVRAALPSGAAPDAGDSLVGQLLLAAPDMGDPRFQRAVILMALHSRTQGGLGIAVNLPLGERSFASLMRAIGDSAAGVAGSIAVFAGGPVEPSIGFVVHSAEYHRTGTVAIDDQVAMTSSPEVLRDIAHGRGPRQKLIAFGYTGWAPGQLEMELAARQWVTTPETPRLVFEEDRRKVWDDAITHRSVPL